MPAVSLIKSVITPVVEPFLHPICKKCLVLTEYTEHSYGYNSSGYYCKGGYRCPICNGTKYYNGPVKYTREELEANYKFLKFMKL